MGEITLTLASFLIRNNTSFAIPIAQCPLFRKRPAKIMDNDSFEEGFIPSKKKSHAAIADYLLT